MPELCAHTQLLRIQENKNVNYTQLGQSHGSCSLLWSPTAVIGDASQEEQCLWSILSLISPASAIRRLGELRGTSFSIFLTISIWTSWSLICLAPLCNSVLDLLFWPCLCLPQNLVMHGLLSMQFLRNIPVEYFSWYKMNSTTQLFIWCLTHYSVLQCKMHRMNDPLHPFPDSVPTESGEAQSQYLTGSQSSWFWQSLPIVEKAHAVNAFVQQQVPASSQIILLH